MKLVYTIFLFLLVSCSPPIENLKPRAMEYLNATKQLGNPLLAKEEIVKNILQFVDPDSPLRNSWVNALYDDEGHKNRRDILKQYNNEVTNGSLVIDSQFDIMNVSYNKETKLAETKITEITHIVRKAENLDKTTRSEYTLFWKYKNDNWYRSLNERK